MSVKVLTDSTSYIKDEILKELDILEVSLSVKFEDEEFKEVEIDNESFFEKMDKKEIPMSSQPSVAEMMDIMESVVKEGDSLLCIFLSSKMSGTYSSAHMVREQVLEKYPQGRIEILDSQSNCMQLGFAVIAAARAAKDGKDLQQVKEKAEENLKRSRFIFLPHNLTYLKKGGRIGAASALVGNILNIIPILTVEDGVTTVLTKVRTKKKAIDQMIDKLCEDIKNYGIGEILVHHINNVEGAKETVRKIKEAIKMNIDIQICDIGPVIGLHVGPGAIGIAYYTEKAMR
ncbi:MAG: DegV family protein [Clostridiales bacterium]|uniref:DegV family protein n=1 Tax=Clostridium sp. N3C TaxID=1776758 RepID=UPI00092E1CFF|nr:DegV family protein [Clostridium sp. N3C]NLZ49722.1 DegV family protein [Clostridiales bacterium]SCN25237.1 DegV domain-containing protein [Clostridium sp. N3C]